MTQTIEPGQGTRNLAPYISHPPTLRRPDAAETAVIFVVEPIPQTIAVVEPTGTVYQRPPGSDAWIGELLAEPATELPPVPQPPAPESLMKPGRTLEFFGPERRWPWAKEGTRRRPRRPAPAWVHVSRLVGLGVVLGVVIGVALTLAVVTR